MGTKKRVWVHEEAVLKAQRGIGRTRLAVGSVEREVWPSCRSNEQMSYSSTGQEQIEKLLAPAQNGRTSDPILNPKKRRLCQYSMISEFSIGLGKCTLLTQLERRRNRVMKGAKCAMKELRVCSLHTTNQTNKGTYSMGAWRNPYLYTP